MNKKNSEKKINYLSLLITSVNFITFILFWFLVSERGSLYHFKFITYQLLFLSYYISFIFFNMIFDSYAFNRRDILENTYSLSLSCIISCCLFYFLDTLAFRKFNSPLYLLFFILTSIGENYLLCSISKKIIFKDCLLKQAIIYYHNESDIKDIYSIRFFNAKYKVIK